MKRRGKTAADDGCSGDGWDGDGDDGMEEEREDRVLM
jgi:hypothetical protein